jgi:hypothetical protein
MPAHTRKSRHSPCGLGKDWRSFTGIAEVDRTGVQRFQELRSGWKLRPLDRVAKRLQLRFQKAFVLQEDQRAVLLIADADDLLIRGGRQSYRAGEARPSYKGDKRAPIRTPSHPDLHLGSMPRGA